MGSLQKTTQLMKAKKRYYIKWSRYWDDNVIRDRNNREPSGAHLVVKESLRCMNDKELTELCNKLNSET